MENGVKNLFEYLKEIYQLKTRAVQDYKKFDKEIDVDEFEDTYSSIADIHKFSDDISNSEEYFTLKYITVSKPMPKIPTELKEYIDFNESGIVLADPSNTPEDIKNLYNKYNAEYKESKKINDLITKYNDIYQYFFEINRRIQEFEEKFEVVLGKGLFVYKTKYNTIIRRHIFEAPLKIDIKTENNTIYLRIDKQGKANIEYNFLPNIDFQIKDRDSLLKTKKEYEEKFSLDDNIDFDELYNKYLNSVAFNYEYVKGTFYSEIDQEKAYIFDENNIIVRKKQPTIWMEDLNNIVNKINNNEFNTSNVLPYLIIEKDEGKIQELLYSNEETNKRILFPLPSNEEQYKVVRQTEGSNLVLVQGPPGTGKSHTIANLISNYVSDGKRILVTSEKSKALEVIREKLPDKIRDLSMALLSDAQNTNELSNSIQIVLDRYKDKDYLNEYEERIQELEKRLDNNIQEKQKNHDSIIQILLNNSHDYKDEVEKLIKIKLSNYMLIDIAKYLANNQKNDYIEDTNNYEYLSFNKDFLYELNTIGDELKKYYNYIIDREYPLPVDVNFERYQDIIKNIIDVKNEDNVEYLINDGVDEKSFEHIDIDKLTEMLENVINLEKFYSRDFINKNCTYTPRVNKVKEIINKCISNKEFFETTEQQLISNKVEYNIQDKQNLKYALEKVIKELEKSGDKLSIIDKIKLKNELNTLLLISVNDKDLKNNNNIDDLRIALNKINYDIIVESIKNDINATLGQSEIWNSVNDIEFSRSITYISELLNTFADYNIITNDLDEALKEIYRNNVKVLQYIKDKKYQNIYEEIVITKDYNKYLNVKNEFERTLKELENKTTKTYGVFEELITAFKEKDLNKYKSAKNKVEEIYDVDKKYTELKRKYENEIKNYPKFIKKYVLSSEDEKRKIITDFQDIFDYYKLKMFLFYQELNNSQYGTLFEKKEEIQKEQQEIIVKLIEEKSWYNQIKSMNNAICKSLAQWLSLKTKLGKGTGKRANIIRREMQEQMEIAKEAIPIWIMPLDKVVEQYPYSNTPQFDVIIMDESSQSSIISLSALLRGKKMIIVGDDKQISPISVGITIDSLKALEKKYLEPIGLGIGFDMDMSIYDLAQNVCGSKKVVLKEHFRCLPEIIEFSNMNFYGNQINCLKVKGKENTIEKPIETYFLPDATVNVASSANLVNQEEVNKIVEILKNIENDKSYYNKNIGIIVLQNSVAQIKAINTAIWKNFDNNFIRNRKLKIGNSYEFQGDERDVIILSMVISKKQEDGTPRAIKAFTTKEYERSFNVAASRAKEQVILVYSVNPNDLNKDCLRYKLITYYNTFNNNNNKIDIKLNTEFEKDLYKELKKRKIDIIPHFRVGKYEIDFIINDSNGKKIAVECDGDIKNTKEQYENEIVQQDVLMRCGWKFIRIRASQYFYNKEKTINEIMEKIDELQKEDILFEEPIFKAENFVENKDKAKENIIIEENDEENSKNDNEEEEKINNNRLSEIIKNINLTQKYVDDDNKE